MNYKTKYIGIWVTVDNGKWYVTSDNGYEQYLGVGYTDAQVDDFKNAISK